MFPKWFFSKNEQEQCDAAYSSMSEEELAEEVKQLQESNNWTPEQFAALDPEDQQYVLDNLNAINEQIDRAKRYLK